MMSTEQENMELMQTLDDAWNAGHGDLLRAPQDRYGSHVARTTPNSRCGSASRRGNCVLQDLPRPEAREPPLSSFLCFRRLDLLHRPLPRHYDWSNDRTG